jgi:hypothetical protein
MNLFTSVDITLSDAEQKAHAGDLVGGVVNTTTCEFVARLRIKDQRTRKRERRTRENRRQQNQGQANGKRKRELTGSSARGHNPQLVAKGTGYAGEQERPRR